MPSCIPFSRRKTGVCYAITSNGTELPVVDVSHPSFALSLAESDVAALWEQYRIWTEAWNRKPRFIQRLLFALAKRKSVILQGVAEGEGGVLSGLNTYLMKLGPGHMDPSFSKRLDPKVARGVPIIDIRLRLQNMANLIAEALELAITNDDRRHIRLINIAGGPAMDSINAIILLKQHNRVNLKNRRINIQVLDQDINGPIFGARAFEALSSEGGPINGFDTTFTATTYDWRRTGELAVQLEGISDCIAAGSSEGGLFSYGSDEEILENLEMLRRLTSPEFTLSGSMSVASTSGKNERSFTRFATRSFVPGQFEALVAKASWRIDKQLKGPSTVCFRLAKIPC